MIPQRDIGRDVPRLWRQARAANGPRSLEASRQRRRTQVLGLLLLVLGLLAGVLSLVRDLPTPRFVPLFITEYRSVRMPVPADAAADRDALTSESYFRDQARDAFADQELTTLQRALDAESRRPPIDSVVVMLSGFAAGDTRQRLMVYPADADPEDPSVRLDLTATLRQLGERPARHRLTILDLARPIAGISRRLLIDDASLLMPKAVQAPGVPPGLVLASASPGQRSLASQALGRSPLGWYLEEGLRGYAAGYSPLEGDSRFDGRISAQELGEFVRRRVDRWSRLATGVRQTPTWLAMGSNFDLIALPHSLPLPHLEPPKDVSYPKWLQDGWAERDRRAAAGFATLDPVGFYQIELNLMRAEQRWRGGSTSIEDITQRLQVLTRRLDAALAAIPRPSAPHSLALLSADADPSIGEALGQLLTQLAAVPPPTGTGPQAQVAAAQADAERSKLTAAFLKAMENKPTPALALAIFDRAADEPQPSPAFITRLVGLLQSREPTPTTIEALFLNRLAGLAGRIPATDWPTEAVHAGLSAVRTGDRVLSRPRAFPWMRGLLTVAQRDRGEGVVLLLSTGYAPTREATERFRQAASLFELAQSAADVVETAQNRFGRALALVLGMTEYAIASDDATADWERIVVALQQVSRKLKPPQEPPATPEALRNLINPIRQSSDALAARMDDFLVPFAASNRSRLAAQARLKGTGPDVLRQIEHLLQGPYLSATDRIAVWQSGLELARQLSDDVLARDQAEDQAGELTPIPDVDLADSLRAAEVERVAEARRRARLSVQMLRSLGVSDDLLKPMEKSLTAANTNWNQLADDLIRTAARQRDQLEDNRSDLLLREVIDNLGHLFQELTPSQDPTGELSVQVQAAAAADLWGYLANRFRDAARDSPDRPAAEFLTNLASNYRQIGTPYSDTYVEWSIPTSPLVLTPEQPRVSFPATLAMIGPNPTAPDVQALVPETGGLRVRIEPLRPGPPAGAGVKVYQTTVTVERIESDDPAPAGFLLSARTNDWTYHARIAVNMPGQGEALALFLDRSSRDPTDLTDDIRLRPVPGVQKRYLFVRNGGSAARDVNVRLHMGPTELNLAGGDQAIQVPPGQTAPVIFGLPAPGAPPAPPPAPAPAAPPPAASGTPAAPPAPTLLPPFTSPLTIRVIDPALPEVPLLTHRARVRIMPASEYVDVVSAVWQPVAPPIAPLNRLTFALRLREGVSGPPVTAELVIAPDRVPGLGRIAGGTLRGVLPADGSILRLYAEGLQLDPAAASEGQVWLNIDGRERAILYRVTFARTGDPTTPRIDTAPAVRLLSGPFARDQDGLKVPVPVDNPPAGSRLEVRLSSLLPTDDGGEMADRVANFPTGREERIGFQAVNLPDGPLAFDAVVRDWQARFDAAQLFGRRTITARLIGSDGKLLAQASRPLTLSGTAPDQVAFVNPPMQAKKDDPLPLQATGRDAGSGIESVTFFVGQPTKDGQIPMGALTTMGSVSPSDSSRWLGTLPLTGMQRGPTPISVQFTNNVGLSSYATTTVELLDMAPKTVGRITGVVLEGTLPQPGLMVTLADMAGKEAAKAMTAADGSFAFEKLAPGTYKVSTAKSATNRKAEVMANVTGGMTAAVTLNLSL